MRIKLVLAYVGTAYCGWQIQCKPSPPPTIQGELEKALAQICGENVRVFGAGRTDAGVHAHAQVAHVDVPQRVAERRNFDWRRRLNALLPDDIRIVSAAPCATDFHARNSAVEKIYLYQFWQDRAFVPPALAPFVWRSGPLDMTAMQQALTHVPGERDWRSLQNAGTELESTVRNVISARLLVLPSIPFYPPHAPMLCLEVTANGFLKQMVRNLAGLLAFVGRGQVRPDDVPCLLDNCDRMQNPAPTAPAEGLFLARVVY